MKKTLIAFAALAAAIAAPMASASDLTLFGTVDSSARHVKNGPFSANGLASGGNSDSRFGMRGTEDLGGGLKAGFHLEHGFQADSGSTNDISRAFNRRATVSLMGSVGEFRAGRDTTPTFRATNAYDLFGQSGLGSLNNMIDAPPGGPYVFGIKQRSDNQVAWISPEFRNFTVELSHAPLEAATAFGASNRYTGGSLSYALDKLTVNGSHGVTRLSGTNDFKQSSLGASYDLGAAKLQGGVIRGESNNFISRTYQLGASAPLGGSGELKAQYARTRAGGSNHSDLFGLGYVHNMSKRTAIYTSVAHIDNGATASRGVTGSGIFGADSRGYELGLRHSF